jgi:hypothetical protein
MHPINQINQRRSDMRIYTIDSLDNATDVSIRLTLDDALADASDERQTILVTDGTTELRLNAYGTPIETMDDDQRSLFNSLK